MRKWITVMIGICCMQIGKVAAQQNIQFTQYIFNSLSINPAYAGYKEEWFVQLGLRAQWVGIEGAPQTATASIDGILDPLDRKMGLGVQITTDKIGAQAATSATLNYAYRLQLDGDDTQRLSFGLGIGAAQYSIKGQMLTTAQPGDEAIPVGNQSNIVPDLRLGVFYNSDYWYVGLSALDLFSGPNTRRNQSFALNIIRSRHAYMMGGALINVSPEIRIRPSILIKEDFRGPTSADFNTMFIINDKVWIGGSIRTGFNLWKKNLEGLNLSKENSISGIVQFFVNDRFRVGYSYDHVTSMLGSGQNGSHEITMGLAFGKVPRSFICPRVF
ncbi:PorP/SprF family type IX secretion system membrane protein [Pedobacter gandavensis]|uniref:Type IX secretion system membrane protein PorP/SprF n=1 Tax=Pedobacter gandavensis TaxID=2679963 RepID=A0ABR6EPV1_9SPHI|nr:type IX secretion system membrane protein PorP/SprF [Pedobacter gandavensis]MBB2147280.1 type IX secretion system membrane protein PorP/SprF [Pedobacter gandavensis]